MTEGAKVLVFFCVLMILGCACVQGAVTYLILKGKGYWSNGFWWGFFLGPIGLAVVVLKPYMPQEIKVSQPAAPLKPENTKDSQNWKCTCGRQNAYYISSCTCGRSKRDVLLPRVEKKPVQPAATSVAAKPDVSKPVVSQKHQTTAAAPKPAVQQPKPPVVPQNASKPVPPKPAAQSPVKDIEARRIAALKEYKAMLDCGIISQEEFDARKKHILSL